MSSIAQDFQKYLLDHTKIQYYPELIAKWQRGERFAPITIDAALTRSCNLACRFCYAQMQENERKSFTQETVDNFVDDAAEIGVKGISLVSDGESQMSPHYVRCIERGADNGLAMASGTNGLMLSEEKLKKIIPKLTYLRFNISAGEKERYNYIMGASKNMFETFCKVAENAVRIKRESNSKCTLGFQMVLMPEFGDQIIPLSKLALQIGVDYLVIKHCSDSEDHFLGVDYGGYEKLYDDLRAAEAMSTANTQISIKWSKIGDKGTRSYQRCYGPPFLIQLSGSGLIAPCGMLFGEEYRKFHMGNLVTDRFKDVVFSDRYWEVVNYLASEDFNAQRMCGSLCLQHKVNEYLDGVKKGTIVPEVPEGPKPEHIEFV